MDKVQYFMDTQTIQALLPEVIVEYAKRNGKSVEEVLNMPLGKVFQTLEREVDNAQGN